jgi:hypothetical protein
MQDLLTQAVKQQHQTVLKKTRKKAWYHAEKIGTPWF